MSASQYAIGLDFGTNSVRALIVDIRSGEELATAVGDYRRGDLGVITDPENHHLARQHPADYRDCMEAAVRAALAIADEAPGFSRQNVVGIGVDTTGSSPMPVDASLTPLCDLPAFADNPDAMTWLWKDHTSAVEAEAITTLAAQHRPQYLQRCGGAYSSEWFWSKLWRCRKVAPAVFEAAHTWLELCDYIPVLLTGQRDPNKVLRSVCAAGHKAMYAPEWGGLPDTEFLALLDPAIAELRARLYENAVTSAESAGGLCDEWAQKFGLPAGIAVAVGAFDAHHGAVGAGVAPGTLVKIIGTSTCDITVAPEGATLAELPGVCGYVTGSVLPGVFGIEAGQSAVGDLLNWFVRQVCQGDGAMHVALTDEAARLAPAESGLIALDWNNGNRTILVDVQLTGLLLGQTLHTSRAEIYRALIEATAFGAHTIHNRMREYGVPIERVVAGGGIAEKNPLFMQTYADVDNTPIEVARSRQICALGAAIFGAVAGGGYATTAEAQAAMASPIAATYTPDPTRQAVYAKLYSLYRRLHDSFGVKGHQDSLYDVMKTLLALKKEATGGHA